MPKVSIIIPTHNDWETIPNGGASKIQEWIDNQLKGRTCTVVLLGENNSRSKMASSGTRQ